jgi:hypothetical protein
LRTLIKDKRDYSWRCSNCAWRFKAPETISGDTMEEMKDHFELHLAQSFAAHVCSDYPKGRI